MHVANQAISRRHTQHSTIDDVITELSGSAVFSHLDMSKEYHQGEFEKCNNLLDAHWSIPIQEVELRYEVCR